MPSSRSRDAGSERGRRADRRLGGGEPSRRRTNSVSRPADRAEEWVQRRKYSRTRSVSQRRRSHPATATTRSAAAMRLALTRPAQTLNLASFALVLIALGVLGTSPNASTPATPFGAPRVPVDARRRPFPSPVVPSARSPPRAAYEMASATPRAVATDSPRAARAALWCLRACFRGGGGGGGFGVLRAAHTVSTRPRPRPRPRRPRRGRRRVGTRGAEETVSPTTNPPFGSLAFRAPPRSSRTKRPRRC